MSQWQPNPTVASEILTCLQHTLVGDNQIRKQAEAQLERLSTQLADLSNYLVFFLTNRGHAHSDESVRSAAGLMLKNHVLHEIAAGTLVPAVLSHVQLSLFAHLNDPSAHIRSIIASIIASIVRPSTQFESWPSFLESVAQVFQSPDANLVEGASEVISMVCEDNPRKVKDAPGNPLNFFVPAWIHFAVHGASDRTKVNCLSCLQTFIVSPPAVLKEKMGDVVSALGQLLQSRNPDILVLVIRCFIFLCNYPQYLGPVLPQVVDFMLFSCRSDDENVGMIASEFFGALSDVQSARPVLLAKMPQIVPVLLSNMKYSDMELALQGGEDVDSSAAPDRPDEINPRSYMHLAVSRAQQELSGSAQTVKSKKPTESGRPEGADQEDDDDFEDDDDDNGDDAEDAESANTVRRSAAASLDSLAACYPDELLPVMMEHVQRGLQNPDWLVREACILAIGAVADGCYELMEPSLSTMFPFLWQNASQGNPPIQRIACWTLGKYIRFAVSDNAHVQQFYAKSLELMLSLVLHVDKRVQKAACSAIWSFCEEAPATVTVAYVEPIVQTFIEALKRYQHKNMINLLDAVSTLVETTPGVFAKTKPAVYQALAEPILAMFGNIVPSAIIDDPITVPILEAMSAIVHYSEDVLLVMADRIVDHSLQLFNYAFTLARSSWDEEDYFAYDRCQDTISCCLDILCAFCEALGPSVENLLQNPEKVNLIWQMISAAIKEGTDDVRRSAIGLLGDFARTAYGRIAHLIPHILQLCVETYEACQGHLEDSDVSKVVNNILWSAGEIALKTPAQTTAVFVPHLLSIAKDALLSDASSTSLRESAAVCVSRLALSGLADMVASSATTVSFMKDWFVTMRSMYSNDEKHHGMLGMARILHVRIQLVESCVMQLFWCLASYSKESSPEVIAEWASIFQTIKQMVPPPMYADLISKVGASEVQSLRQVFPQV
eukprot:ANDGO_05488.mRNA.1 Importin subunit beta-2